MLKALTPLTVPTDANKDSTVVDSSVRNGSTPTTNTPTTTTKRHRDNEDDDDDTMIDIYTRWEHLFRLLLPLLSMLYVVNKEFDYLCG